MELIPTETYLIPEALWDACVPNMWDIKMAAVMVLIKRLQNRGQMVDQMAHLSSLTYIDALSHTRRRHCWGRRGNHEGRVKVAHGGTAICRLTSPGERAP